MYLNLPYKKLSLFPILFAIFSSFGMANGVADIQLTAIPKSFIDKEMEGGGCMYALPLKKNKIGSIIALEGMFSSTGFYFGINNKVYKVKDYKVENDNWVGHTFSGNVYGKKFTIKRGKYLKSEHEHFKALSALNFYDGNKVVKSIKLIEECGH